MRTIGPLFLLSLLACNDGETATTETDTDTDTDSDTDTDTDSDADSDSDADTDIDDPCDPNPCANGGTCEADTAGDPVCECATGYEGDTCENEPFTIPAALATAQGDSFKGMGIYSRVQWLPAADQLPTSAVEIHELRFRRDLNQDPTATLSNGDVRVSLSTIDRSSLANTFATNLGTDATEVHTGPVDLLAKGTEPLAFEDWVIPVQPPFAYDPANGRLMLDIIIPAASDTNWVAMDCNDDSTVSMRFSYTAFAPTDPPPTSGSLTTNCGFAVQFGVRY